MAREDRATWAKRVERWKDSGLTAAEFGAEVGVSPKALSWWKWQLSKKATPAKRRRPRSGAVKAAISPMTFVEMTSPAAREPLEIVFVSGVRIRVPAGADQSLLQRVIEVLEKRQ